MRADNTELTEVMESIDVESMLDSLGVKYTLARGSRGLQANVKDCPCCGNSNYKVYLNAESGLGNCFVCEQKFNKWSFLKAEHGGAHNRDVVEYAKTLAREQGWKPKRRQAVMVNVDTDLKIPESIPLPYNGSNIKYLANRNISSEIAKYFSLRYCHTGRFEYLDDDGMPKSQNYGKRIIIPIFDLEGELVSFQGRDITGESEKKYLFPPGFAATGSHLYNGQNAVGVERIAIGEGVFDVYAMKMAFDSEPALRDVVPVGSFGKHLSVGGENSQMARLLELKDKGLKQVTLFWDGEPKAIAAAVETALQIKSMGIQTRVAILPEGKDPNEITAAECCAVFWKAETINPLVATRLKLKHREKTHD